MVRSGSKRYKKKPIPKAVREAIWLKYARNEFEIKCKTTWCPNRINAFTFQAGHNIAEAHGGATDVSNLVPICSRCNQSMGSQYSFDEWCKRFDAPRSSWWSWFSCLCVPSSRSAAVTTTVVPELATCYTKSPSR